MLKFNKAKYKIIYNIKYILIKIWYSIEIVSLLLIFGKKKSLIISTNFLKLSFYIL